MSVVLIPSTKNTMKTANRKMFSFIHSVKLEEQRAPVLDLIKSPSYTFANKVTSIDFVLILHMFPSSQCTT